MESHSNLLRALPRILRSSLDVFKGTRNLFFSTSTRKTFTFEQQQQHVFFSFANRGRRRVPRVAHLDDVKRGRAFWRVVVRSVQSDERHHGNFGERIRRFIIIIIGFAKPTDGFRVLRRGNFGRFRGNVRGDFGANISRLSGGESGEDDRRRGRWAVSASGEYVLLFFCEGKRRFEDDVGNDGDESYF